MVGASSPLRALHSLQAFFLKPPSSNISSMKIKTTLHSLIISHVCKLIRALAKTKSVLVFNLKTKCQQKPIHFVYPTKNGKNNKKIFFGSFRLHYNWCSSSHVMPVPQAPILDYTYYDASWNSIITTEEQKQEDDNEAQLAGYLKWLEEKKVHANNHTEEQKDVNEIDMLAEIFIANCHEKFILEKQESYRRFQEMLARSM